MSHIHKIKIHLLLGLCWYVLLSISHHSIAQVLWANKIGGSTTDMANALTVDQQGNVIITGSFSGKAKIGNDELFSLGGGDVFVASFSPQGKLNWHLEFGSPGDDFGSALAVNANNDIVVCGIFSGNVRLGDLHLQNTGGNEIFILWLDAQGKVKNIFSPQFGHEAYPSTIKLNKQNKIGLAGWYSSLTLGNRSKIALGETDFFMALFDAQGQKLYHITGGGLGLDECTDIHLDEDGNLYAIGTFVHNALLGPEELNGRTGSNAFFSKINHNGVIVWYKTLNSLKGNVVPQHLAVSNEGELFAVGFYSDTIWDKGFVSIANGQNDVFCVKINSNGNYQWLLTGGSEQPDRSYAIKEEAGKVYWLGLCNGNARFGKKSLHGMKDKGNFYLALDARTGKILAKQSWQRNDEAVDNMAQLLPQRHGFALCGYFTTQFNTGTRKLHSAGEEDAYVLIYDFK